MSASSPLFSPQYALPVALGAGHAQLRASPCSDLAFMDMPRDAQTMVFEQLTFTSFKTSKTILLFSL